jgi:hypothetical protein
MHVLEQPVVLSVVLQYAGPKQWLFLGGVSKAWAAMLEAAVHERLSRSREQSGVQRAGKATSFTAAAASLDRALYACACDGTFIKSKLLPLSEAAAATGSRDVLIWVKATAAEWYQQVGWHQQLCLSAVRGSQLTTLQWLLAQSLERLDTVKLAAEAAEHADLAMLQWACDLQPNWTEQDVEVAAFGAAAAATDAIEKLDWLHNRFPEHQLATPSIARKSIVAGVVQSLQWLAAQGLDFRDLEYTTLAASHGQFGVMRYLVESVGCPLRVVDAHIAVAKRGSAEDLQWLRAVDENTWTTAVLSRLLIIAGQNDNLQAVMWLRAAGAEWPASFLQRSSMYSGACWSLRAMQCARASGCPWGAWSSSDCVRYYGHMDISMSVFDEKQPWNIWARTTDPRILDVYDAMLWAHAAGCPCDNWLHHLLARLKYWCAGSSTSGSSDSSGSSSSSVYSSVPHRWRYDELLFREFFCFTGSVRLKLCVFGGLDATVWLITKLAVSFASSAEAAAAAQERRFAWHRVIGRIFALWFLYQMYARRGARS